MKVVTFQVDDHKIELYNSLLGKETVMVDDKIVSSAYSLWGMSHKFNLEEDALHQYRIETSIGGYPSMVNINLYRNDEALVMWHNSRSMMIIFFFLIGLIAAIFF